MLKEFKDFIMKGNLVEIAVGLILALAFTVVVQSLVADIINQLIAAVLGSTTPFEDLAVTWGSGEDEKSIVYGGFLNALLTFIVVGFVLFLVVKAYNKMLETARRKGETEEEEDATEEVVLLREIRDQLAGRP